MYFYFYIIRRLINAHSQLFVASRNFVTIINQYERGLRYTFGVQQKNLLQPGIWFYFPILQRITDIDMRSRLISMQKQEMLTNDYVKISLDAIVQFKITDIEKYVNNLDDLFTHRHLTISKKAETELREVVSSYTLNKILDAKQEINDTVVKNMQKQVSNWGIDIECVKMNNVVFDESLVRAMIAKTEAQQKSEAKIISANADIKISSLYNESANKMDNENTFKLRQLECITKVATEPSSKIIFFPSDALNNIVNTLK